MDANKFASLLFIGFWILVTLLLLILGQVWPRLRSFRACMLSQWKPALGISSLFLLGMVFGGRPVTNPYALAVFCQALIGLALANGIPGLKPLPAAESVLQRHQVVKTMILVLLTALLAAAAGFLIGNIGLSIAQQLFHETANTREATNNFAPNAWQAFWLFLCGAGIAEETTYRLVLIPLLWRIFKKPFWAILLAALIFGAYHLTPLTGMYQTFQKFPVSQFLASALIGLVWGWVFVKRGYESAVLAHTFSDWIPMLIFMR